MVPLSFEPMPTVSDHLRHNGYALFAPNELADTSRLLAECQKPLDVTRRQKSFLDSLLTSQAIKDEVQNLLLDQRLAVYLGQDTYLKSVDLYRSTPSNTRYKSGQLWHLDIDLAPQVKMFFMCRPTTHDNGPFTWISAQDSLVVQDATGYIPGKSLDDTPFQTYKPMELVGDAGALVLVDTSRCLHFGSRCTSGERIALVVQYARD